MQTLLVANPKGGSGKTTLATNVAGWLAGRKQKVALADLDVQQSACEWVERRPPLFPPVASWTPDANRKSERPQWLVIDSPAGLHGDALRDAVRRSDIMLVPISPSVFDMSATQRFLQQLNHYKAVKEGGLAVAIVGMRVDSRTRSATELAEFVAGLDFSCVTDLRDTQVYVHCAREGLSVFDLPRSRAEQDWDQWRPLTRWIGRASAAALANAAA
jgi:chromosome partitioning protein